MQRPELPINGNLEALNVQNVFIFHSSFLANQT